MQDDRSFFGYIESLKTRYAPTNRLLLVNPPQLSTAVLDRNVLHNRGYYLYPPAGLLHLSACTESMDICTGILDINFEVLKSAAHSYPSSENLWKEILLQRIEAFAPSLIGVTCMFSTMWGTYESILRFLMESNRFIVLAGGPHVTFEFKSVLDSRSCHFAFKGESEDRLPYLLDALLFSGMGRPPVSGIFYKDAGEIRETKGHAKPTDVHRDITGSYRHIPIEEYCLFGSLNQYSRIVGVDKRFSTLQLNRGCRAHCTFCTTHTLMGKGIRSRSIDSVVREIIYLKDKHGIVHFDWLDDDFLYNRKACIALFCRLIEENVGIKWYANNGLIASSLDEDILGLMVASGCVGFKIGIESGNYEIRKKIRKPASMETLLNVSQLLEKFPTLHVAGNYIIGFPGETFGQMLDTFVFANKMSIDWSGFYLCQPLKGTDLYDTFTAAGIKEQKNFIPTREFKENFGNGNHHLAQGMNVFAIPRDIVTGPMLLNEIWFSFNIITNFINSKNLRRGEAVDKFIQWVEAAMSVYPEDAGMALFLYLASLLKGDADKATDYHVLAKKLHMESGYWQRRFEQFMLLPALDRQYRRAEEADKFLSLLRKSIAEELQQRAGLTAVRE